MGELNWLLGIQITFTNDGINLSHTKSIVKILSRFSMHDCNPVSTHINSNKQLKGLEDGDQRTDATAYQQMIGSLMYLVTGTRPDLAYTITHLSQFNSSPSTKHLMAAKGVLRYLQGTKDRHLFYPSNNQLNMTAYTNASYSNCLDTRRSFQDIFFKLETLPSPGDVKNSSRLLLLPVKLSIWHMLWWQNIIFGWNVESKSCWK